MRAGLVGFRRRKGGGRFRVDGDGRSWTSHCRVSQVGLKQNTRKWQEKKSVRKGNNHEFDRGGAKEALWSQGGMWEQEGHTGTMEGEGLEQGSLVPLSSPAEVAAPLGAAGAGMAMEDSALTADSFIVMIFQLLRSPFFWYVFREREGPREQSIELLCSACARGRGEGGSANGHRRDDRMR